MPRQPVTSKEVERITTEGRSDTRDLVAVEEPLQILLEHGPAHARRETPLAITMRTPGHDPDLVRGFLYGEGVIQGPTDVLGARHCQRSDTPHNVLRATLHPAVVVPEELLARTLTMTSACGVCGERTVEALDRAGCAPVSIEEGLFSAEAIRRSLHTLEGAQAFFRNTGGTHGAALFGREGDLVLHREDVGRHNALDKVIGAWLGSSLPASESFLVVSSRASFELVQKAVRAGFPMLVAMGAATSLAVDTASRFSMTLAGFARPERINVYSGALRIAAPADDAGLLELGAQ